MLGILAGCSTIELESPHLNISKDGYVTDNRGVVIGDPPRTSVDNKETETVASLTTDLDNIVDRDCRRPDNASSHLMLVVHGGLVSTRAALEASLELDDEVVQGMPTTAGLAKRCGNCCAILSPCRKPLLYDPTG